MLPNDDPFLPREVAYQNYRVELQALSLDDLITRAYLDNGRQDWECTLAREEHARRIEVEGPFR